MLKGMDISEHNGIIDFAKAKMDGIQFVMIRAGYGKNNIDKSFIANIKACNDINIPCGVYWFSYASTENDAKQEAVYCLQAISPFKVHFPVCFDLEYDTVTNAKKSGIIIDKVLASKMANAFLSQIETQGYYAMNYSNLDYINNMFDSSLNRFDLWFAQWNVSSPIKTCGIWQSTGNGKINGVSGDVDIDYSSKDYQTIILKAGLNKLSTDDIEVIKQDRDLWKNKYTDIKTALQNFTQLWSQK